MKTKLTRFLLIVLTLIMFFGVFSLVGCGGDPDKSKSSDVEIESTGETDILAHLPKDKYNEDFMIVTATASEFYREDSEGDRIDYAIYMRNATIEERFGVNIKTSSFNWTVLQDQVDTIIKANDLSVMDLVAGYAVYSNQMMLAGQARNWKEVDYIDLSADWWSKSILDNLTLNDQVYILVGDMQFSAIEFTYCMFYNKKHAVTYNVGDVYETVMSGNWTFETLQDMVKTVGRKDLNADNRYNAKDFYGFMTAKGTPVNNYVWAFENPVFTRDQNDELQYSFYTKKLTTICSQLVTFLFRNDGVHFDNSEELNDVVNMFANDQCLFVNAMFHYTSHQLRDMPTDSWGVLPYPKWNKKQTTYITGADGMHTGLFAPNFPTASEKKLQKLGVITEAMTALSRDGVRVEYYDKALKSKYIGDPKEAKMIDLIMDNRIFDFGYIYLSFDSPFYYIQDTVPNRNADIASYYARKKDSLEASISKMYDMFGLSFEGLD